MPSLSLAERFAALKNAELETVTTSDLATVPTHLNVLLEIYNKASHDCYISYMEGFKLLLDWLCPTAKQLRVTFYKREVPVPSLAGGYSQSQVSSLVAIKLLGSMYHPEYLQTCTEIDRMIFIYCAKSIPKEYLL